MREEGPTNVDMTRIRALVAKRRWLAEWKSLLVPLLLLGVVVTASMWNKEEDAAEIAISAANAPSRKCALTDARCNGKRVVGRIQEPCTRAVEAALAFAPEWTNGALTYRFDNPALADPSNGSIMFTGNHLLAQNGFGAKRRISYFCHVSRDGALHRAGVNE